MNENLFRLSAPDVHVWPLELDLPSVALARAESLLSAEESLRACRFVREVDRRRFIAAHGQVRVVLARYLACAPGSIGFETGARGKPVLRHHRRLRFSMSHGGDKGLVAVARDRSVGVDIEEIRALPDLAGLAETCLSSAEKAVVASSPEVRRSRTFLELWTLKEAFLKATGEGLSRSPTSVDLVRATRGMPDRLQLVDPAGRYTLQTLDPAPGFVGAVAAEGPRLEVAFRLFDALAGLAGRPLAVEALA